MAQSNAERQRRYRERKGVTPDVTDVTPVTPDIGAFTAAMVDVVEELYGSRVVSTMARRRLLDALGRVGN